MEVLSEQALEAEARIKLQDAEERLRLAVEATGLGTWDLDLLTGEIIHSPRLAEIFGKPSTEKLTHQALRDQIHPDDVPVILKAFDKALKKGTYFYEARVIWDSEAEHWIRTHGKVVYNAQNEPVRLIGTILDVTGQRILIDELKRSEENLRMATQAAELGTFDYNIKENSIYWDERCRVIFGITGNRDINYGVFLEGLHEDDRLQIDAAVQSSFNKKET